MSGISTFFLGCTKIFSDPMILVLIILGVFMGVVFGSIPGLTGALGISLILPFTYKITAEYGLSVLIAIYVGSIAGGLISAILLNIPGTPSSLVTCFDGAPMAKKSPGKALVLGTFSSLVGGLAGGFAMILLSGPLATFALQFGYWEYFSMGVMGLCIVVSLVGKDMLKGYIAACIGLLIGMVGTDSVSTVTRFTYGFWQLNGGFSTLPVLMGLFALTEIMVCLRTINQRTERLALDRVPLLPKREWLKGTGKTMATASLIGTGVGILPGVGQTTASIGIPGDVITSILLGALVLHGLQPGALLFNSKPEVVGVIFAAYIFANIIMYLMMLGLMQVFVQMLRIPLNLLYSIILCACMVGAMVTNNRVFDAGVLIVFGIIGYFLVNNDYPIPPLVLGFVLSSTIEKNFRTAMIATDGSFLPLFQRPIALILLAVGILMALMPTLRKLKNKKKDVPSAG